MVVISETAFHRKEEGEDEQKRKESRQEKYLYVQNTGNKKVLLMGVKIGMTSSATKAKLVANGFRRRSATVYTRGEAGFVKLSTKKSKITGWKYYIEPTS